MAIQVINLVRVDVWGGTEFRKELEGGTRIRDTVHRLVAFFIEMSENQNRQMLEIM